MKVQENVKSKAWSRGFKLKQREGLMEQRLLYTEGITPLAISHTDKETATYSNEQLTVYDTVQ